MPNFEFKSLCDKKYYMLIARNLARNMFKLIYPGKSSNEINEIIDKTITAIQKEVIKEKEQ